MSTQTCPSKTEDEIVLSWNVHLARQNPLKLAIFICVTIFTCAAAYWTIGAVAVAAMAVVMIVGFADFIFPMRFALTKEEAICRSLFKRSEIKWKSVRRCYLDDHGVKLSPLNRRSHLKHSGGYISGSRVTMPR